MKMLSDPEWSTWSSNEIAKQCVVSQPFVDSVKAQGHTSNVISMDAAPAVEQPVPTAERTVTFTHPKTGKPTQMKTGLDAWASVHLWTEAPPGPIDRTSIRPWTFAGKWCDTPRRVGMTIHQLLQGKSFGPDEIAVLVAAYEATLKKLGLVERDDPLTQLVAKKIIELAQRGVRDPKQLSELAIREMGMG